MLTDSYMLTPEQIAQVRAYIDERMHAFSDLLHAYACTPEGEARAEFLRDQEYDRQKETQAQQKADEALAWGE